MLKYISNSSGPFHSHTNKNTIGLITVYLSKMYLLSSLATLAPYFFVAYSLSLICFKKSYFPSLDKIIIIKKNPKLESIGECFGVKSFLNQTPLL